MPLLHPAFLFALAAAAIPVIIHLSQRRKFKEFDVGTLRFLQIAEKKRHRRLRIEELLLLLLRIGAVALLALMFARPFLSDREKTEATQDKTLLLLDASGSMTAAMAEKATDAARKAIKEHGAVTVAQFTDAVQVLSSLEDYRPVAGASGDFNKALGWSLDHLRSEGAENTRVVIIGHFASSALPSAPPRVWPPRVQVEAIAIQPPDTRNEAVKAVELLTPFAADNMEIEARVTSSNKPREVALSSEGLNVKQTVPAGVERVLFSFRPPREEVRGFISLEGKDEWPADDRRPFAMHWAEPEPVLILDGFPGSTPFEGQGYFLQKALTASGAAHGLSPYRPEVKYGLDGRDEATQEEAPVQSIGSGFKSLFGGNKASGTGSGAGAAEEETLKPGAVDLAKFSAISICGPTAISPAEARAIAARVAKGAGLFICIDERWKPESTAALVNAKLFPESVELSGGMQQRRIAWWDRKHPALASFDGKDGGDLRMLTWRDAFTIQPSEGWKPLATLDGGHPLLLEKVTDDPTAGRVMVLAHPLTREWSDLPREPMFVPLAKSLFNTLTHYEARQHSANVRFPGTRESREIGYYQTADGTAEVVAADPAESAVIAVDAPAFCKAYALPDATEPLPPATLSAVGNGEERPKTGEWWPWLVLILLSLLTLECAVATRKSARLETSAPVDA
ncbi:BatA domain-containing protein [Luteolibacter arcticus]|uniref:BatA domain-containing protein n=1 Tax=Luteolibacter arcticus TaxID=1581411 RepID=A0ABT3GCI3_9BACT|nr:BatA domain-containing protein [Luteolibacter arcticus]MCW1921118.1 BatA domain-containing protein [Luteolibacter arcticus]